MFSNEFDSLSKQELFEPRVTSSPSSSSRSSRHDKSNALAPWTTYVKYGANDLELTTANVQLIATPTSVSKKRKPSDDYESTEEKILRKINSSIMKNVEKRRGCSFNSQRNTEARDNLNLLKTAFRQTSGSLINGCFDNKNSFDNFGQQQTNQLDTLTTRSELEMLDTLDLPPALPPLVPKRRKLNPTERLNFKRGKNRPDLLIYR